LEKQYDSGDINRDWQNIREKMETLAKNSSAVWREAVNNVD
jgi:hypothetical protein